MAQWHAKAEAALAKGELSAASKALEHWQELAPKRSSDAGGVERHRGTGKADTRASGSSGGAAGTGTGRSKV